MKIKVQNGITSKEEFTARSKTMIKNKRKREPNHLPTSLEMLH